MRKHGTFSVKTEGQVVIVKLFGSFNELGARTLTDSFRKEVESLNDLPFAELIDAQKLEGIIPEGFELIEDFNIWQSTEKKLVALAIVTDSTVIRAIARKNLPSQMNLNLREFDNRELALQWLREELLKAGNEKS